MRASPSVCSIIRFGAPFNQGRQRHCSPTDRSRKAKPIEWSHMRGPRGGFAHRPSLLWPAFSDLVAICRSMNCQCPSLHPGRGRHPGAIYCVVALKIACASSCTDRRNQPRPKQAERLRRLISMFQVHRRFRRVLPLTGPANSGETHSQARDSTKASWASAG